MASSITGRPIPQETKADFGLRAPGRSIAQVNSGIDEPPSAPILSVADARSTPTITWPPPDLITYGDKLTFAQLNATASVEGTLVYTPGPGYVLPAGMHTLWVTFTPEDSGTYAPQQAAISIVVAKATPASHLASTCRDNLRQRTGRYSTQCLDAGTWNIQLLSRAGRRAPSWNAYALGNLHPRRQRELRHSTGHRAAHCGQGNACHPMAEARSDYIRHTAWRHAIVRQVAGSGNIRIPPWLRSSACGWRAQTFSGFHSGRYFGLLCIAGCRITHCGQGNPCHHVADTRSDCLRRGPQRHPAQCRSNRAGIFCLYTCCGRDTRAGSARTLSKLRSDRYFELHIGARRRAADCQREISPLITWPVPSAISYGTALNATQLNATASVPGTFVYTPSAGHVLAPGRYTLSASFTPLDAEKYATAQATVVLEVEGSPDIASLPTAATETPSTRTFTAISSAHADPAPAEVMGERTATKANLRETRMYKGAVYEKGEDGQWHLQKK